MVKNSEPKPMEEPTTPGNPSQHPDRHPDEIPDREPNEIPVSEPIEMPEQKEL